MATSRRKRSPGSEGPEAVDRPLVTFERDGQTVWLDDLPHVGALDALSTVRHDLVAAGDRGPALVPKPEPLVRQLSEWTTPNFGAGLAPAADAVLVGAGYNVHYRVVTSPVPVPLAEPDDLAAGRLGVVDRAVLDFVHGHERGVVAYGAGVDPGRLAAQAALAFPAATFAVVASRVGDVRRFHERYRRAIPGLSWAKAGSCPAEVGRVVVATPYGLSQTPVNHRERAVVIALNALEVLGERALTALGDIALGRLFALRPRDRAVAPRDRDRLAPLFGFDELVVPRHGCVERPVEAAFTPVGGGPRPAPATGTLALMRQGVWNPCPYPLLMSERPGSNGLFSVPVI